MVTPGPIVMDLVPTHSQSQPDGKVTFVSTTTLPEQFGQDGAPSCVTVKIFPAMVVFPVLELVLEFDETE